MAKRKRLAVPDAPLTRLRGPATTGGPFAAEPPAPRPPVAQVAGDAAVHAALDDVTQALTAARAEGRLAEALPLTEIKADHLVRDRMTLDAEEMTALKASIAARGQQTPIEVVALEAGGYGLISGWRRLQALTALASETEDPAFATIKALVRPVGGVSDCYVAMVEENEIRVGLSYYERAHLAAAAVELGIYRDVSQAIATLFVNGSAAKRSKIAAFVRLHDALGAVLSFPAAIPERLGLALAAALDADPDAKRRLRDRLRKTPPADAAAERKALERALKTSAASGPAKQAAADITPGVRLEARASRITLSGKGVTPALRADLEAWLRNR